ncbi:MAG: tryptophan--tRNA ligase [Defluviitaleaceae bacterium]|nr:tryptophan--tRNA ligase [Defluviitaleaceae bacterium]
MTENTVTAPKKIIFSGMQPTGYPTLGNYLGAIKNWGALQEEYDCLYCIVDMHAITVRQDPAQLRKNAKNLLALFIACGLDPEENILYMQSQYHGHAELSWILNCYTYMGELGRMTQFKEKSAKNEANINTGLFTYPVLMAADILLFGTALVPVGDDQRQHLELSRDVAMRFNNIYGDVFTVPEAYIPKSGARIMSLTEPTRKMSKSDEENSYVSLMDAPDAVIRKFKRAVTDSDMEIRYDQAEKPGISNLLEIYANACGISIDAAVAEFEGKGYGHLKTTVGEAVVGNIIEPVQGRFAEISKDAAYLDEIMKKNAQRAAQIGERVLKKVKKKVGFVV